MTSGRFRLDGKEYETQQLSQECRELVERLRFVRLTIQDIENRMALLSKAKNGYIEDLKTEIIQERTGVDFSNLFSDE